MSDNIEPGDDTDAISDTPIWLIIVKWILVVINCMWMFADSIALIMGSRVTTKVQDLPDSDSTIRIQASIELIFCLIGLIGLIGQILWVLVFHCIANAIYYTTLFIIKQSEVYIFTSFWVATTIFYIYQIRCGRYRRAFGN